MDLASIHNAPDWICWLFGLINATCAVKVGHILRNVPLRTHTYVAEERSDTLFSREGVRGGRRKMTASAVSGGSTRSLPQPVSVAGSLRTA